MLARIIFAVSLLFVVTACSTTKDGTDGAASSSTTSGVAEKYRIESEGLDPFTFIRKNGDDVVRASDRVFFEYDSSTLDAASQSVLDRQVSWLKSNSSAKLTVEGHCDERGTREYNLALGERRANAVKNYLVSSGIQASRVATISYGKERPAVLGHGLDAYAENRRAVSVPDNM